MTVGWSLITMTFLFVVLGCVLYLNDSVGWAQFLWVLASGSAGAAFAILAGGKRE